MLDFEEMLDRERTVEAVGLRCDEVRAVFVGETSSSSSEVHDDGGLESAGLASLLPPP